MLDETTENKIKEEVDENIDDKSLIEEDTKEELSSVSNAASTEEKTEVHRVTESYSYQFSLSLY